MKIKNFYHEPTRTNTNNKNICIKSSCGLCGSWLKIKKKSLVSLLFIIVFFSTGSFNLSAQGFTVSGVLDTSVSFMAATKDAPNYFSGFEEYANIRFQSKIKDKAAVYGAVNLIAASGIYAKNAREMSDFSSGYPLNRTSYVYGENYIAGIELERLYFRLFGESTNFDCGLMRLPFGYGQVWGPSDFLNPKNPLKPDARLRAILGAAFFWYPTEETKLSAFYSAPRDPFSQYDNSFVGLAFDKHWVKASVQTLYCYETPNNNMSYYGIHRAGFSVKADLEIGLVIDALYTFNPEEWTKQDGLSFSAGADYSFFDGKLIVLAEYLYNGNASSTAFNPMSNLMGFSNNNYLYTSLTWRINDFTNISAALISGFDDVSFTPVLTFNYDLFQGTTLTVTAQVPVDRALVYCDDRRGELGPNGYYFYSSARIRVRF